MARLPEQPERLLPPDRLEEREALFTPILQMNIRRLGEVLEPGLVFGFLMWLQTFLKQCEECAKNRASALGIQKELEHRSCPRSQCCFPYIT